MDRTPHTTDVLPDVRGGPRDLVLPVARHAAAAADEDVSGQPDARALIDAFCDQLWLQDGLAAASLASYRRDLTGFAAWLGQRDLTLLDVQRAHCDAWLAHQFASMAKASSVARRLSALRRFYRL